MNNLHKYVVAFLTCPRHYLRWALIHCALMFFFADLLASVWPSFNVVWGGIARIGVSLAALFATGAEYLHEETGKEHKNADDDHEHH